MPKNQVSAFKTAILLCAVMALSCGPNQARKKRKDRAHSHNGEIALKLLSPARVNAGSVITRFELTDEKGPVTPADLELFHEKKLHLLVFDRGLQEFRHLHPTFKNDSWSVPIDLSVNGDYSIWAQGKLTSGQEFESNSAITVTGGRTSNLAPPRLTDVRSGADGKSRISLSAARPRIGQETVFTLVFGRTDGSTPQIGTYLGSKAHVVVVDRNSDHLIHAHPMETRDPLELMLHTTFPEPGQYRLWVQFMDDNAFRVVPLSIDVNATTASTTTTTMNSASTTTTSQGSSTTTSTGFTTTTSTTVPNTTPTTTTSTSIPTTTTTQPPAVSFTTQIKPILRNKCLACHDDSEYKPKAVNDCRDWVSFTDRALGSINPIDGSSTGCPDLPLYDRLFLAPWQCSATDRIVIPGNPGDSYLFQKIIGSRLCDLTPGVPSEKMPVDAPALSANEIDLFRRWIQSGAPNN